MRPSQDKKQKELFNRFLNESNVKVDENTLNKFYAFADFLVLTKEYGNLVSSKDSEKILSRHITDSLVPYIFLNNFWKIDLTGNTWADMGAGAGCPIFPLAIILPQVNFYAVEPRNMRVNFMKMVKEKLNINNLTIIAKRFETSGLKNLNFISCRALSTFENDWERALISLKKGGQFLTLKSYNNIQHLENIPEIHIHKYSLPLEEQLYALVNRGNE